jgi:hypothetical protein
MTSTYDLSTPFDMGRFRLVRLCTKNLALKNILEMFVKQKMRPEIFYVHFLILIVNYWALNAVFRRIKTTPAVFRLF